MWHRVPVGLDSARFEADRERLIGSLNLSWYTRTVNPYPWAMSEATSTELNVLAATVQRAVAALVPAWFRDWRIRRMLPLSDAASTLLKPLASQPYRTGAIRPDFLIDADGLVRISEINARFPLNGFLITHLLSPIPTLPGLLSARLGTPYRILQGRETGWDIRILQSRGAGGPPALENEVNPEKALGPSTTRRAGRPHPAMIVLELHQDEILERAWLNTQECFNDLRTIFIAHDKRLLSVMTSDIVRDYLDAADVERLHRHVIPTWSWGQAAESLPALLQQRSRWVVKPATGGKGEGIVMGHHCTAEQWLATLRRTRPDSVLQPYIEQRWFDVTQHDLAVVQMRVVGTLLILDEHVLGPGIFRASTADVVNVAGGGTILVPTVLQEAALAC